MSEQPYPTYDTLQQAKQTYLAGLSRNTRRAYGSRIDSFLTWYADSEQRPFLSQLKGYVAYLHEERDLAPRSIQAHLNTVKGLVRTAAAIEPALAVYLSQFDLVNTPRVRGRVQGMRLSRKQARILLQAPGKTTPKGLRDTAIIGLLMITGLRRSEICTLTWGHITEIEGHKVIANLKGKHGRIRTIKLPAWLWEILMAWADEAGMDPADATRTVFVPITKDGRVLVERDGMSAHAIYKLINVYTEEADLPPVKPHDLRRTAALLARRGGASIEQVQLMLGHSNPQTTSDYIGEGLDLDDNAVDYNPLQV
ncbi:MAG: site-specific integrase [Chloroflexi bacterium]|nr:site-specific integrase [Chloroflexota bacterium]